MRASDWNRKKPDFDPGARLRRNLTLENVAHKIGVRLPDVRSPRQHC